MVRGECVPATWGVMTLQKLAVDSAAEDYWTEYFSDSGYGEELTRDIPRKVHAQLTAGLARTARKRSLNPTFSGAAITPLGLVKTQTGARFEGAIGVTAHLKGRKPKRVVRAFCAHLDSQGRVKRVAFRK